MEPSRLNVRYAHSTLELHLLSPVRLSSHLLGAYPFAFSSLQTCIVSRLIVRYSLTMAIATV